MSGYYGTPRQQSAGVPYYDGYSQPPAQWQTSYPPARAPAMQPSMSSDSYTSQLSYQSSSSSGSYAYSPQSTSPSCPSTSQPTSTDRPWVCPHPGCRQRDGRYSSFTRKADYQRHIDRLHVQSPQLFNCTYPGCNRTGFKGLPREDKLRDHLREVHKVDVPKVQGRGGQR